MEPPPVQYVRTPDGFDIAYTVCGEGVPLVMMPWPWSHRGLWWQSAFAKPLSDALAQRFRLVQYDSRGQGMSTRGLPEDHSMDDYLLDLDAVVERLELDRFILYGAPLFGHVAVKYAVQHPERLLALILGDTAIHEGWHSQPYEELARQHWDGFVYAMSSGFSLGGAPVETEYWRASLNQKDFLIMSRAARDSDLTDLLSQVSVPTHISISRYLRDGTTQTWFLDDASEIAATIPRSRLDIYNHFGGAFFSGDGSPPQFIDYLEAFLRDFGIDFEAAKAPQAAVRQTAGKLSPREAEVLRLIASGSSNQEIAEALVLSVRTVERHITNLYAKIDARGKADATAYALRNGFA